MNIQKTWLLISLTILLFNTPSIAQDLAIKGQVIDELNQPLVGAHISLRSATDELNGISDNEGKFEFKNIKSQDYQLIISVLGYELYKKDIPQSKLGEYLTINLSPSATALQEVEVLGRARKDYTSDYSFSATKIAILNRDLPQGISSVTKELIADRQAFQIADAVKIASGVTPSSFYNHFSIRGVTQNEEGQIINGMRTRQYFFLQPLTANIERVEVLKGPASVTFSSVDPGGSINMVTKKPLTETRREVSLSAGSFSTIRGTIDFTGPLNKSKTLLYRVNGAYQEGGSFRDLIDNKSVLISPSFTYIPNDKTSINTELIFSNMNGALDRGQPIFGAIAGVTDLTSTPISLNLGATNDFFNSKEFIIMANLSHKFTNAISFNASYMKQTWTEDLQEHRTTNAFATDITGVEIPSLVQMRLIQRKQFWNTDNLNAYFNFNFKLGKTSHRLVVGYDIQDWNKLKGGGQNQARGFLLNDGTAARSFDPANATDYQTITMDGVTLPRPNVDYFDLNNPNYTIRNLDDYVMNSRFAIPSALTTTNAIYIQEFVEFGKFSLLLSLRQEWFKDITNYETAKETSFTNTALIPRIGLTYKFTDNINVYATYLEGYQPQSNTVTLMPSTWNYFWTDESAAQFDPLISDLKEVGIKANLFKNSFTLNVAAYEINQKNILISANDPNNPDLIVQRGADRSRGLEADLAGYILPNWQINASYSFIDAQIVEDDDESLIGKRKENTSKHSGNIWTRYNFNESSKLKDLGIGLGMNAQGSRVPWFSRDFEVPSFVTFDAAIYYSPSKSNVQIALNVNNLLNKTYWVGAQHYTRLFPGAPRNFILTGTYQF